MSRRSKRLRPEPIFRPELVSLDLTPSIINRLFPLEIVSSFMGHCQPNELCLLSRTCRAWKSEAERVLYGTIYLEEGNLEQMWSCLRVLATNAHRAALVRSFNVFHPTKPDRMLLKKVFAVLPVLPSLVHLGLLFLPSWPTFRSLIASIKHSTFTLTSLSVGVGMWPSDWMSARPRFNLMRIAYRVEHWRTTVSRLLPLFQNCLALDNAHLVFTSYRRSSHNHTSAPDTISVFPGFAPGFATWDPRLIKDIFCVSNGANVEDVRAVQVYLANLSDAAVVRSTLEPIANIFEQITTIFIHVQEAHKRDFTEQISVIFASFKMLSFLSFGSWSSEKQLSYQFSQAECDRMAAAWWGDIPGLKCLYLPNRMVSAWNDGQWGPLASELNAAQYFLPW